jgi:hypothetical protein
MVYAGTCNVNAPDAVTFTDGQSITGAGYGWLQVPILLTHANRDAFEPEPLSNREMIPKILQFIRALDQS